MIYDLTIEEYLKTRPMAQKVAEINKPHSKINYNRPLMVYYESVIGSKNDNSTFALFNNGIFVGNPIMFPCEVSDDDRYMIGKDMIDELLSHSDFDDLNKELKGMAACQEYEKTYKACDECPLYISKECFGATYSIPSHMNSWEVEKKWKETYGDGSPAHISHATRAMIGYMNSYMWICGKDKQSLAEILAYGKSHPNNKHEDIFK